MDSLCHRHFCGSHSQSAKMHDSRRSVGTFHRKVKKNGFSVASTLPRELLKTRMQNLRASLVLSLGGLMNEHLDKLNNSAGVFKTTIQHTTT